MTSTLQTTRMALLSHNFSQMQDKTTRLETTSAGTRLKINTKKAELMEIITTANTPITVGGKPNREVNPLSMGSWSTSKGAQQTSQQVYWQDKRVFRYIGANVWVSKHISIKTKTRILNSNVKSVFLYGCETWRTTNAILLKIRTFFDICLRRIYIITWPLKIRNQGLVK
jgi:hypothetical protein